MASIRKFNQAELRKLIQEQNSKIQKPKTVADKIQSPLAKYDAAGNLHCIICKIQVKANVWKVHVNSKQHKQKTEETKLIVEKSTNTQSTTSNAVTLAAAAPITTTIQTTSKQPTRSQINEKVNNSATKRKLNDDHKKKSQPHAVTPKVAQIAIKNVTQKHDEKSNGQASDTLENGLPEKFFDDAPRDVSGQGKDATKDPLDDEWNRFQREIKEESSVSYKIVVGQQDEAAIEREIEEIDEQLKRWQKVVEFENKTAKVLKNKFNANSSANTKVNDSDNDEGDSEYDEDTYLEFPDWRAKKLKL